MVPGVQRPVWFRRACVDLQFPIDKVNIHALSMTRLLDSLHVYLR
jgi:hypothetical protein